MNVKSLLGLVLFIGILTTPVTAHMQDCLNLLSWHNLDMIPKQTQAHIFDVSCIAEIRLSRSGIDAGYNYHGISHLYWYRYAAHDERGIQVWMFITDMNNNLLYFGEGRKKRHSDQISEVWRLSVALLMSCEIARTIRPNQPCLTI